MAELSGRGKHMTYGGTHPDIGIRGKTKGKCDPISGKKSDPIKIARQPVGIFLHQSYGAFTVLLENPDSKQGSYNFV